MQVLNQPPLWGPVLPACLPACLPARGFPPASSGTASSSVRGTCGGNGMMRHGPAGVLCCTIGFNSVRTEYLVGR